MGLLLPIMALSIAVEVIERLLLKYTTLSKADVIKVLYGLSTFLLSVASGNPIPASVGAAGYVFMRIVGYDHINSLNTGTKFNINTYKEQKYTQISLESGILAFKNKFNNKIYSLKPGDILHSEKNTVKKETTKIQKIIAWKDGVLIFDNEALSMVAKKLIAGMILISL